MASLPKRRITNRAFIACNGWLGKPSATS